MQYEFLGERRFRVSTDERVRVIAYSPRTQLLELPPSTPPTSSRCPVIFDRYRSPFFSKTRDAEPCRNLLPFRCHLGGGLWAFPWVSGVSSLDAQLRAKPQKPLITRFGGPNGTRTRFSALRGP